MGRNEVGDWGADVNSREEVRSLFREDSGMPWSEYRWTTTLYRGDGVHLLSVRGATGKVWLCMAQGSRQGRYLSETYFIRMCWGSV